MKKKKILFIIPKICNGGAERRVVFLANEFSKLDYQVSLLSFWDTNDEYPLNDSIKRIHLWKKLRFNHHASDKLRTINLFFIINKLRPKVIITMHPPVAYMVKVAGFLNHFKLVDLLEVSPNSIKDITTRIKGWNRANKVFLQCDKQLSYMPNHIKSKCVVIGNPVADSFINTAHTYKNEITNFISVGRLDIEKNHELLINAFNKAYLKNNKISLTIYGKGPLKEKLINLRNRLGLENVITFIDRSNDMPNTYNQYDAFILSSNFEGMPNSLLEAMAVGLPSISTDCDTGPSDLIDKETGILVDINNIDQLANAILSYANNPLNAEKLGKKGKTKISINYNQKEIISKYSNEINRLFLD